MQRENLQNWNKRNYYEKTNFIISCMLCAAMSINAQENEFPKLTCPYLGQKPPGVTPEVFAPGIVSTEAHEFSCSFMPDGGEFYFTRKHPDLNRNVIMVTKNMNGVWLKPEIASFNGDDMAFEPRVTPDGSRLYFTSSKPLPGGGPPMNVWFVERKGNQWGVPQNPGEPFNPMKTMYISVSFQNTVYTTDISGGMGNESIIRLKKTNGKYAKAERIGPPINTGQRDMYPFVTPDENCLIFCSNRPAEKNISGLFVSFRNQNGAWQDPKPVPLGMKAGMPLLSPDGKYLLFTAGERGKSDIYWVSAEIIEALKPRELN